MSTRLKKSPSRPHPYHEAIRHDDVLCSHRESQQESAGKPGEDHDAPDNATRIHPVPTPPKPYGNDT